MAYQFAKVKISGLPVWKHHPKVCPGGDSSDDQSKRIKARIAKWEEIKEKKKKERKPCQYGCGKTWAKGSISSASVRRHILGTSKKICPNFPDDGTTKVKEFYHTKKRLSFSNIFRRLYI